MRTAYDLLMTKKKNKDAISWRLTGSSWSDQSEVECAVLSALHRLPGGTQPVGNQSLNL